VQTSSLCESLLRQASAFAERPEHVSEPGQVNVRILHVGNFADCRLSVYRL
jgi:hypothetical protein